MNKYLYAVIQIEIEFCFLMKMKKKKFEKRNEELLKRRNNEFFKL